MLNVYSSEAAQRLQKNFKLPLLIISFAREILKAHSGFINDDTTIKRKLLSSLLDLQDVYKVPTTHCD